VADLHEGVQGLLPAGARPVQVAGGLQAVTHAHAGVLHADAGAVGVPQIYRPHVVVHGRGVVAEVLVDVAEAVEGAGGPGPVAEPLLHGESLLAVPQRLLVVAEQRAEPADAASTAHRCGGPTSISRPSATSVTGPNTRTFIAPPPPACT